MEIRFWQRIEESSHLLCFLMSGNSEYLFTGSFGWLKSIGKIKSPHCGYSQEAFPVILCEKCYANIKEVVDEHSSNRSPGSCAGGPTPAGDKAPMDIPPVERFGKPHESVQARAVPGWERSNASVMRAPHRSGGRPIPSSRFRRAIFLTGLGNPLHAVHLSF